MGNTKKTETELEQAVRELTRAQDACAQFICENADVSGAEWASLQGEARELNRQWKAATQRFLEAAR